MTTIEGNVDSPFEPVREAFAENFASRGEVGASVAVYHKGELVVDLWGGTADPSTGRAWTSDTVGIVQSCTKAAYSVCAHTLVHAGELDLDRPVAHYWPQFAKGGKEDIPVWMVMAHLAALPAISKAFEPKAYLDPDPYVAALAAQEPFWEPGTRCAYHNVTYGYMMGEIIRRVSGQRIGPFFQEHVAGPLGLDFWIGLPTDRLDRVAPSLPEPPPAEDAPPNPVWQAMTVEGSIHQWVYLNSGGYFDPGAPDEPAALQAEIPNGGVTNAKGLAGMYAAFSLDGEHKGVRLVSADQIERMRSVHAAAIDAILLHPVKFGLGFMKSIDNRRFPGPLRDSVILSDDAFGHMGGGGRLGFADPRARLSFGYTMNQMAAGTGLDPRGQALVDAVYSSIGHHIADGRWVP